MRRPILLAAVSVCVCAFAPAPTGFPPPGLYRIDMDATMVAGSGPTQVERRQQTDGATGDIEVTTRAGPDGGGSAQAYAGGGPNTWCVPARSAPPPPPPGGACRTAMTGPGAMAASCAAADLKDSWRRVDDRTWERTLTVAQRGGPAGGDPRGAIAMAMPGLSPADQARARAELATMPTFADTRAAMAPVLEAIRAQTRSSDPEEAAAARAQLAALEASLGGSGPQATTTSRERWVRIAETCTP